MEQVEKETVNLLSRMSMQFIIIMESLLLRLTSTSEITNFEDNILLQVP